VAPSTTKKVNQRARSDSGFIRPPEPLDTDSATVSRSGEPFSRRPSTRNLPLRYGLDVNEVCVDAESVDVSAEVRSRPVEIADLHVCSPVF
jgi:hypothetical protein